jgi:multidrug efflux pump subunit AcrA (membrane-fusion protein)
MVAKVALPANASEARVLVPRAALLKTPIGMAVFIAAAAPDGGAHRAELRMVSIGPRSGDSVSILEGLSPGEYVVVEGQFALADGDAVVVDTTGAP